MSDRFWKIICSPAYIGFASKMFLLCKIDSSVTKYYSCIVLPFIIFWYFISLVVSLWTAWSEILFRVSQIVSRFLLSHIFHFFFEHVFSVQHPSTPCQSMPQKFPMGGLSPPSPHRKIPPKILQDFPPVPVLDDPTWKVKYTCTSTE